jgi:hypothetical protein
VEGRRGGTHGVDVRAHGDRVPAASQASHHARYACRSSASPYRHARASGSTRAAQARRAVQGGGGPHASLPQGALEPRGLARHGGDRIRERAHENQGRRLREEFALLVLPGARSGEGR